MSHSPKPKIISQSTVDALMRDPEFFNKLPEFRALQSYKKQLSETNAKSGGCRSCKKRRAQHNLLTAFIHIVGQLNDEAKKRLKLAVGSDRLMYHGFNRNKGSYELREI